MLIAVLTDFRLIGTLIFALLLLPLVILKQTNTAPNKSIIRIFLRLRILTLGCAAILGAFNYVVNPLGIFPTHWFPPDVPNSRSEKLNSWGAISPAPQAII